jgi:hypothetical protein
MCEQDQHDGGRDEGRWAIAADIGKRILVGITFLDSAGNVTEQTQHVGEVVGVEENFIIVRWDDGEETTLPPEVVDAAPGVYRLRSTGEEVENPDLLARWTVSPPEGRERVAEDDGHAKHSD